MPFTFSHPAAMLPAKNLNNRWFSFTTAFFGSMAPDYLYYVTLDDSLRYSHTFEGLFTFGIPAAIILSFIFHLAVKKTLIANLPFDFPNRLMPVLAADFVSYAKKNPFALLSGALAGAASHLLIDIFTHDNMPLSDAIPFIHHQVPLGFTKIPLFFLLQILTSIAGLIILAWYARAKLAPEPAPVSRNRGWYWFLIFAIALITPGIFALTEIMDPERLVMWVIAFMLGLHLAALINAFIPAFRPEKT